jgi:hypothetical protein
MDEEIKNIHKQTDKQTHQETIPPTFQKICVNTQYTMYLRMLTAQ